MVLWDYSLAGRPVMLLLGPFVSASEPVLISWGRLLHITGGQLAGTPVTFCCYYCYYYVTGGQQ